MNIQELKQIIYQGEKQMWNVRKQKAMCLSLHMSLILHLQIQREVTSKIWWNDRITYNGTWENNLLKILNNGKT
ncbi:MAG: hypothetical protein HFJ06_01580 [Lachnospiraceae bacterium]|nr:hypothetical protein [Lachnospiraceae bacterium]